MMHDTDAPIDPFAHRAPTGWWAQHEQQMFAKKDDDEDDDLGDDDDADDDDEDDDPDAEKSEDELRAELKAVRDSLSKASGSSKKKRDRIKALEADLVTARTAKPAPDADGKPAAPDADAIRATIEAELKEKADTKVKRAEARGALRSAGVPVEQVGDLVAMLKLDDLDVDDEGEVEGLDEAIDGLKKKWPQLFGGTRKRRSVSGDGDRDGDASKSKKTLTPSELQARVALGRSAR